MNKVLALGLIGLLGYAWTTTVGPGFWSNLGAEAQSEVVILAESAMKLSARIYQFIHSGA